MTDSVSGYGEHGAFERHAHLRRAVLAVGNRKLMRKDLKKLKKAKQAAFHGNKKIPTLDDLRKRAIEKEKKKAKKKKKKKKKKQPLEGGGNIEGDQQQDDKDSAQSELRQKLDHANAGDQRMINMLEKKMKMRKKTGSIPQPFMDEGLDYILETIGSYNGDELPTDFAMFDKDHAGDSDKDHDDDSDKDHPEDSDENNPDDSDIADDGIDASYDEIKEDMIDSENDDAVDQLYNDNDDSDNNMEFTDVSSNESDKDKEITFEMDTSKDGLNKSILKMTGKITKKSMPSSKSVKFVPDENVSGDDIESSDVGEEEEEEELMDALDEDDDEDSVDIDADNEISDDEKNIRQLDKNREKNVKRKNIEIIDSVGNNDEINNIKKPKKLTDSDKNSDINEVNKKHKKLKDSDLNTKNSTKNENGKQNLADIQNETEIETETESGEAVREDIYGRLRDSEGNVLSNASSYITPGKRLTMSQGSSEQSQLKQERLRRQLRGLINRTSVNNMHSMSTQMEQMYREYSRADMNFVLTSTILDACISPSLTPERLVMELVMLVAVLHSNIGSEVGAYFLQTLVKRLDNLYSNSGDLGKEVDNAVACLTQLYNFEVIDSCLIFDVLTKFHESFGEKDIELILLVIKNVGFSLRKEDPQSLKVTISSIQTKAQSVDTSSFKDASRVKFMIEILLAVRNNNMHKIPNYDTTHIDHLRKQLHNYIKGSRGDSKLKIHYEQLLSTEEHGRWWIVGSAWSGEAMSKGSSDKKSSTAPVKSVDSKVLSLASKQRMNTEIRRNIFCVVMTSDDYLDAYEKLLRLGLHHVQEREIIFVVTDCCLQEKSFNRFYAYLMDKLCHHDRRFETTFQFHVWDKLKSIGDLSDVNRDNLAHLLSHLLSTRAVSMSVIKVIEFGTLNKETARLLRSLLTSFLTDHEEHVIQEVFARVAIQPKLSQFMEGLKLFLRHFMLKGKVTDLLRERVGLACEILGSSSKIRL